MKLELLNFIKSHENWEELLIDAPYYLKICRDGDYILFKYDQIHSDFSLQIVKEARGIIFDEKTWSVVCFPFTKFFNVDETNAATIDWDSARVLEKIDGSLMKLWCETKSGINVWKISTNGCIDAFKAELGNDICEYKSFGELFMSVFDTEKISFLNPSYTYMYELVSPYTKIVIDYPKTALYHLGTRDNKTGKELETEGMTRKPECMTLNTEKEVREAANALPFNLEGYVVVDKDYHRVKIKSPLYVSAHRLVNNKKVTMERVLDLIRQNEQDEFLSYFPDYKSDFNRVGRLYNLYKKDLEKVSIRINKMIIKSKDKKDFALKLTKKYPLHSSMGFMLYNHKINTWEEYLDNLKTEKVIERIRLYET